MKPDAPLPVTLISSASTSITVQVHDSEDNQGSPIVTYSLYVDEGSLGSQFSIYENLDPQDEATYTGVVTLTGLTPGAKYGFYAKATNSIGQSE